MPPYFDFTTEDIRNAIYSFGIPGVLEYLRSGNFSTHMRKKLHEENILVGENDEVNVAQLYQLALSA